MSNKKPRLFKASESRKEFYDKWKDGTGGTASDSINKSGKTSGKSGKKAEKTGKTSGKSGVPLAPKTEKLTKTEKEILGFLSQGITNPKTLMTVLKAEKSTVYNHLRNLRKKGLIDKSNFLAEKFKGTISPTTPQEPGTGTPDPKNPAHPFKVKHQIRLHGQQFRIKILWSDNRYVPRIGKTISIDGNTVICNREVVQIHGIKTFVAESPFKAVALSMEYYNTLFMKVQNDLKIILIKNRAQNVDMVRLKLGETQNEITKDAELTGERIRVYAKEDGKLWFDMDESFYLREAHFLHPQTAQEDTEQVLKQLNDFRDNKPPTISEVMRILKDVVETVKEGEKSHNETAAGLNAVVLYLKTVIPEKTQAAQEAPAKTDKKADDPYYGVYA